MQIFCIFFVLVKQILHLVIKVIISADTKLTPYDTITHQNRPIPFDGHCSLVD